MNPPFTQTAQAKIPKHFYGVNGNVSSFFLLAFSIRLKLLDSWRPVTPVPGAETEWWLPRCYEEERETLAGSTGRTAFLLGYMTLFLVFFTTVNL
jgi:hypothetical protein